MFNYYKSAFLISRRPFKNFGHKREHRPLFTTLWHGFLTFTFIGLALDWDRIATFFFGKDHGVENAPFNPPLSHHIPEEAEKT